MKKFMALILTLVLISGMVPMLNFGVEKAYAAGTAPTGAGTEEDPYQIVSEGNLVWLSDQVASNNTFLGKCFVQKNDITLAQEWSPIGDFNLGNNGFSGTYDGDMHFINNLIINVTALSSNPGLCIGLFGSCDKATIKNVRIFQGNIKVKKGFQQNFVGGICGYAQDSNIMNCSFNGSITNENTNTTTDSDGQTGFTGGIVGMYSNCGGTGIISGCYNEGMITGSGGSTRGGPVVGGIAGMVSGVTILNCYNTGAITNTGVPANDCAAGGILGRGGSMDGMGDTVSKLVNCYNSGTVHMTYDGLSTAYIGGNIGWNMDTNCANLGITNTACYYLGGTAIVSGSGIVTNTYDGMSKTDIEMKTTDTFSSWDTSIWNIQSGQYPTLKAFVVPTNHPPTAKSTVPTQAITETGTASFNAADIAEDADSGDTLTIASIETVPAAATATATLNSGTVTVTGVAAGTTSVMVKVSDGKTTVDVNVPITVTADVNQAPTDIALSASTMDENAGNNAVVGTLSSTDPDEGDTFTYTLVTGTGDTDNASFNISGNTLCITNSPDCETKSSYTVRVCTTDQGGLTYEKTFIITVNNVNETPTITVPATISVTENVGSALTGISFADVDAGSGIVTTTMDVGSGTLSATAGAGVTVSGSGTASMTLSGTISDINAFIAASKVSFTTALNATVSVTLTVGMNDGGNTGSGGAKTASSPVTLTVTPVNHAPTLSTTASNPTFTENGNAVYLFSGTSMINEGGQNLTNLTLTVNNLADGSNEILKLDGSAVALTDGNNGSTATNGMTYSVSVAGSTATVTVSKTDGISSNAMQTLVFSMKYQNASENPNTASGRTVTLTSLTDNGGTSNGGVDTSTLSCASMVTVVAVNDAPVVITSGTTTPFNKTTGVTAIPVVIDSGITVSDVDNATLSSGMVSLTGNFHSGEDILAFVNDGSTMGNISASYDASTGVLMLNSSGATATVAQWQSALRAVTYTNSSDSPNTSNRTISFLINDGAADSSVTTKTVSVSNIAVVPGAPTGVTATAGDASVTVSFTEPASNGGAAITEYIVTSSGGQTATGGTSPITITGLTNGSAYTFTVKASNSVGTSSPSSVSNSVTPRALQTINFPKPNAQDFGTTPTLSASATSGLTVTFTSDDTDVCDISSGGVLTFKKTGTARITAHQEGNNSYLPATAVTQEFQVNTVVPSAPTIGTVTAGNRQATVSFTAPASNGGSTITGYTVMSSPGGITATGTTSPIIVPGLTNGTAYTFIVKAMNSAGISSSSAISNSITPTVNSTISSTNANFDKKTSAQADITITMILNGNTLNSIKNGINPLILGRDYTVSGSVVTISKAYLASQATGVVTLTWNFNVGGTQTLAITVSDSTPSNNSGGSGGSSGGSGSSSSTTTTSTQGASVIVNGENQTAGNSTISTVSGQTVTTVDVDTAKMEKVLEAKGDHATVTIPVTTNSDVAIAGLTGQMIKNMEEKKATLEVKTGSASYTLPASEIDIDSVSKQLGQNVGLSDINVQIKIAEPSAASVKVVENSAKTGDFTIMVPAVEFSISSTYSGKTVDVSKFNSYVERTVAIPDGIDPTKITTGIVVSSDGKVRHVPTQVIKLDGKYYAKINSLTNSTYTVVWHPITFADVANHWARDAVNNMGSRMVVTGVGNDNYNPNNDITRAEFAAILVRALGLEAGTGENKFSDVKGANWFSGYVETASKYGIINGYNETTFAPNDKITREQAMTMISRAMKITKLEPKLADSEISVLLAGYTDVTNATSYAKPSIASCLKTGVVSGNSSTTLAPKSNITRAEVAVIVERLLKKSELI